MEGTRMVRLTTVAHPFSARVIAARMGSEGIVTELRGSVDGPYPMGDVHIYVSEDDLPSAQELLLADEVESAFDPSAVDRPDTSPVGYDTWIVIAAIVLVTALVLIRYL